MLKITIKAPKWTWEWQTEQRNYISSHWGRGCANGQCTLQATRQKRCGAGKANAVVSEAWTLTPAESETFVI